MKDAAFVSIVPKQEDAKTKIVYMGERLKRNKMGMSIDDLEYQLCELRDKCIRFKKNGNCKNTNCQKCAYQSVCNMWRMLDGNDKVSQG